MYRIVSEEEFADQLILKLVGSDFGKKISVTCEMQQQLLEKINTLVGNIQNAPKQTSDGAELRKAMNKENDKSKNQFDTFIEGSIDQLKKYAQEQLKIVLARKESPKDGFKNIVKNIKTAIPGLVTAMLGKKILGLFNEWWPKLSKSFQERLDKIFKNDKSKENSQAFGENKKMLKNSTVTSTAKGQPSTKQEKNGESSDGNLDLDLYEPSTAVKVFKKEMNEKKTNYAEIMKDSFAAINSSAEQHFNKMLTGAESFSQGFKGIFKDMGTEISKLLLNIFYKEVIEKKMGKWFGNFLGGIFKAEGGLVSSQTPYIVGERGPELFVPDHAGNIIPNHNLDETLTRGKMQGISGVRAATVSGTQAPPVIVNVVNKSGVQASTRQETKWDGQQYIVNVVMDAYARNVSGMRDVLGVRR